MRQLFLAISFCVALSIAAQTTFKERLHSCNAILFTVETADGTKYVTSDPLFHRYEIDYCGWLKVEDKYKRMGVTMMVYYKLAAGVRVVTWHQFLKKEGIVIHTNDTVFTTHTKPMGTLYEPVLSPVYVRGVKRCGHRVYLIYRTATDGVSSWEKKRKSDSIMRQRRLSRSRRTLLIR